jgi:hypothetical protein
MVTDGAIAVVSTVQGRLRDRDGPGVVMASVLKAVDGDGVAGKVSMVTDGAIGPVQGT